MTHTVLSKKEIHQIEERIIDKSVASAIEASHGLDVQEIFHSKIVGLNEHPAYFASSVRSHIEKEIAARLEPLGIRLVHTHDLSMDFYLHGNR